MVDLFDQSRGVISRYGNRICSVVLLVLACVGNARAWGPVSALDPRPEPQQAPAQLTVDVVDITLDGVRVGNTRQLAARAHTDRLEPLIRKLKAREADWHARHPELPVEKEMVIAAGKSVPFRVVRKLLFSAAQAGYENPRFEDVDVPMGSHARGSDAPGKLIGVWIKPDGYVLSTGRLTSIAKNAGQYDLDALRRLITEQKELDPDLRWILVTPDDDVRYADVASVMSVVTAAGIWNIKLSAGSPPTILSNVSDLHSTLSKAVIREVIEKVLPDARTCYEQYLARLQPRTESEAGRIDAKFIVGPNGAVESVAVVRATLHDPHLQQCLFDSLRRLKFPEPEGGGKVVVTYPFVFAPAP